MLEIVIPDRELYDEKNEEFITVKGAKLQLEHSLVSISKWEAKWHVPFFSKENKTREQTLDYVKCMTLTKNVDDSIYKYIPDNVLDEISEYMENPMTATWFAEDRNKNKSKKQSKEIVTSELVYCWMTQLNIPTEYQKWHFNRLITLIRVCSEKNSPDKKMSKKELAERNHSINAARRAAHRSKG